MNHLIAPSSRIEVARPQSAIVREEKGDPHSSSMRVAAAAIHHLWVQKADERRNEPQPKPGPLARRTPVMVVPPRALAGAKPRWILWSDRKTAKFASHFPTTRQVRLLPSFLTPTD